MNSFGGTEVPVFLWMINHFLGFLSSSHSFIWRRFTFLVIGKKRLLKAIIKTIQMFTLTSTLFVCASANPSSQYLYREKWQVSVKHSTRHQQRLMVLMMDASRPVQVAHAARGEVNSAELLLSSFTTLLICFSHAALGQMFSVIKL